MKKRLLALTFMAAVFVMPASAAASYIYVANAAGRSIDVIDTSTNTVVQVIQGIEAPETVRFSPDGDRLYITSTSENVLNVIDRKSGKEIKKIPLSGHANDMAITSDGKWALVCINRIPGGVDMINTSSLTKVKTIQTKSSMHDIALTGDTKYAVIGSPRGGVAIVVDIPKQEIAWQVDFDQNVLPVAVESNADGSGKRIFVELNQTNGFAVVDFATRKEIARVKNPNEPTGYGPMDRNPSHGLGISPDGKTLWVASRPTNSFFVYSMADLKLLGRAALPEVNLPGHAALGAGPHWITFTPDSKLAYVSNSALKSVSAIDTKTLKEVARIPVGEVPSRISTLTLPKPWAADNLASNEMSDSMPTLDFAFFKAKVAPIFLEERDGHARCYACHGGGGAPHYLEELPAGKNFWTDEQLHLIFDKVSRLVVPGDPMSSQLLVHPLAPESGGDGSTDTTRVHGGGRQFANQADPDWKILAEWVRGQKLTEVSARK
jgi:YVTN family beta-propeller protein